MAKLFQKANILTTLMNVGIGGAANVAMDTVVANVEALKSLDPKWLQGIKIAVGVLGGSLTSNKVLRAATDGIATVGASELVSGLINSEDTPGGGNDGTAGLSPGTIGRLRLGNHSFMRRNRVSGIPEVMGK